MLVVAGLPCEPSHRRRFTVGKEPFADGMVRCRRDFVRSVAVQKRNYSITRLPSGDSTICVRVNKVQTQNSCFNVTKQPSGPTLQMYNSMSRSSAQQPVAKQDRRNSDVKRSPYYHRKQMSLMWSYYLMSRPFSSSKKKQRPVLQPDGTPFRRSSQLEQAYISIASGATVSFASSPQSPSSLNSAAHSLTISF